MAKRVRFICWNCTQEYSLHKQLELEEQPKLIVECPFCHRQGVVDLAKYRSDLTAVFGTHTSYTPLTLKEMLFQPFRRIGLLGDNLPKVISTEEPEEEDLNE